MRTSIVLDDKLIERAQKLTGIKTKREVVHEALRTLILLREQAEVRNLRGKLKCFMSNVFRAWHQGDQSCSLLISQSGLTISTAWKTRRLITWTSL